MDVSNSPADNRSHTPHLPDLSNIPARHNIVTSPHSYGHNERLVFLFSFAELTNCIYKIFPNTDLAVSFSLWVAKVLAS